MQGKLYTADFRTTMKENFVIKIGRPARITASPSDRIKNRDLVAVKLHFGELGNTAFIRPVWDYSVDRIRQRVVQPLRAAALK